ncbi:MAG: hypothetical protein ABS36_10255 [Acidobacteria bacterium SCN 69-37]|nr:MAG: hypothetical protein ABS36_10255 [Acidobacteria bacterium SCN 69-37]
MLLAAGALGLAQRARIDATALVDDLRQLSADAMEGRRVGTAGGARARALLVDRFRAAGLRPFAGTFEQPFRGATGVAGVNVVGYVPGRVRPDRYLVIGAHYDHLGIRDGRVFNGANDNASGAAALAVLAAYFVQHRPATSLVFAAFDGEEAGLVGSRAFVARPPVPRAAILIALNMDMIGRDPANTLWVVGTHQQPALVPLVDQAAARASVVLRRGYDNPADGRSRDWTRDSDHWAFLEAGLPALYFGVEDFALHHDPDDDFDRMTLDFYVRAVESMVDVVEVMDAGAGTLERLTPARPRAR